MMTVNNRDFGILFAKRMSVKPTTTMLIGRMMRQNLTKFAPWLELNLGLQGRNGDVAERLKAAVC